MVFVILCYGLEVHQYYIINTSGLCNTVYFCSGYMQINTN